MYAKAPPSVTARRCCQIGSAGRHGYRFPLVKRHGMHNSAGNPVTKPKLRGLRVRISCLTRHANLPMIAIYSQENTGISQQDGLACRYDAVMLDQPTAMHVARIKSSHTDKQGREREYESRLLRHTYRDGGKVKHKTVANL